MDEGRVLICDNQKVVRYNPYLTRLCEARVKVEVCATVKAVKYTHTYIYQCSSRTTLQNEGFQDEIPQHLNGR